MNFRAWLRRQPKPAILKAEFLDGDEKTHAIGPAKSWARDAEKTLEGCVRVEAFNEKDQVLRVWEAENIAELEQAKAGPEVDPVASSVERIAAIITEACDRAVSRHTDIVKTGFEQMGQLVHVLSQRNAALEKAWQQLLFSQQAAGDPGDPNQALVGTLLQLAVGGGIGPPAGQKPPNGAKDAG